MAYLLDNGNVYFTTLYFGEHMLNKRRGWTVVFFTYVGTKVHIVKKRFSALR